MNNIDGFEVTTEDGVRIIKFNRPHRKNALSREMHEGLPTLLDSAATDTEVVLVVITGCGDYYSSGNDLMNFLTVDLEEKNFADVAREGAEAVRRQVGAFIDFPKPLIAVVNGPAIGIAVSLLGLCDAVYASDRATFQTPFTVLGQSPEGCSSYIFPQIMGQAKAMEILAFNKKISAQEAYQLNLVTQVIPHEMLNKIIWPKIKEYAKFARNSVRYTKQLTRKFESEILHKVNDAECKRLQERFLSEECMTAISNFFNKKSKL